MKTFQWIIFLTVIHLSELIASKEGFEIKMLLPRASSVWVLNDRPREVVFNITGDGMTKHWDVTLIKDGETIGDFVNIGSVELSSSAATPSSSSITTTKLSSLSTPSLSPPLPSKPSTTWKVFRTKVLLERSVKEGMYRVQVCGGTTEGGDGYLYCASTALFKVIAGVSEEHFTQHEQRFKARGLTKERMLSGVDLDRIWPLNNTKCTVRRIHKPTKEEFIERCMKPAQACVISGAMEDWEALKSWPLDVLETDPRLAEGIYIGDREEMVPVRVFNRYTKTRAKLDAAPWMVFMPDVFEMYPELLKDYKVPDYFSEEDDFMTGVPDDLRMDWRWIIMAPRGSGSGWHCDPANTTGWLALATGAKLWGLYPPEQAHIPGVKNNYYQKRDYNMDDAYNWWIHTRPSLEYDLPRECIQQAGDIVYIPSGWYHAVLNLDHTVAVTQNFCNLYSIKSCLKELKEQADSDGNFIGRTFERLRDMYKGRYPDLFEAGDDDFRAPSPGEGMTLPQIREKQIDDLKNFLST
ncbi:uncharacterized protein LOC5501461 [Nematostella vectensis]|uniref:uncharacterized protein LOC5501461 n=1 Tax=Nematostella vectensis TaxID=45351 RepID=UPI00207731DF|nr:uncharacterized protein LOC5501461 [Nematostella vectensis]